MPSFRDDLHSIGAYVPGKPIEEVMRQYGLTEIVKLASNECPQPPLAPVLDAIADAAGSANRYPDSAAHDLTAALADSYRIAPENVWVGPGSSSLLASIALAMGGPGTSAVFSDRSFVLYGIATSYAAATAVTTPLLPTATIDTDALVDAIRPDTTVLYMCNPNNPTGTYVEPDKIDRLVASVPERVLLVIDEAYEEYVTAPDHRSAIPHALERPNVVVTRTFSKIYGLAGLRVGYAIGQPRTISSLRRLQLPFATTTVSMAAAEESLRHPELIAQRVKENAIGREMLFSELERLGMNPAESQTNFVQFQPTTDAGALTQQLLERGVIVRSFGRDIRITVGDEAENNRFLKTLRELI